jgi:hypothetical protein
LVMFRQKVAEGIGLVFCRAVFFGDGFGELSCGIRLLTIL